VQAPDWHTKLVAQSVSTLQVVVHSPLTQRYPLHALSSLHSCGTQPLLRQL
jgi:hypothetical protein